MATIINQREVLLQATAPRMIAVSKNFITVTAPTNTFSTTATGTSPNSIIVRASLSGELRGTVAWTTSPSVAAVVDGNIITIAASLVPPGTSVTITATLTAYGQTYTNSAVISNTAETVVSSLSSASVSVSTAADGSGGNYASATSTMKVEIGTADNSSAWTYSWSVPAGVTATGATTRTISVSAMTVAVDTAALTCTATRTGWPTQTKTFTVSKSKAGTNGTSGVAAYLTNPTHDLLANSGGVVYAAEYTSASTDFVIVEGGVTSTGWTYYVSAISAGVSYKDADDASARTGTGATSGAITALPLSIASLTSDSAYVDITATKSGYTSITLRFSVTRISEAADGVSPVLVNLTGTQAIAYDKDGLTPSPTDITFTASGKNVGTTQYYYRFKVDGTVLGSVIANNTGTVTSASYTAPTNFFATPKTVLVEISTNSAMTNIIDTDTISLVSSRVGAAGTAGVNGTRTAILDLYQWASTAPTTFPSGTSTYTWATAQFTSPATLNSWTATPGTGTAGQTLYIARQIYADNLSSSTSSVIWNVTSAIPLSTAGTNGVNGTRTAFLEVYQWAATAPTTFPSGTSTYTWATGAFTSPSTPNGWSLTPGASTPGHTLYACSIRYADSLTTSTSSITWNTSTAYVVGAAGATGAPGVMRTEISVYKWTTDTIPPEYPTGSGTYTWATGEYSAPAGWYTRIPPNTTPGSTLWKVTISLVANADTTTTAFTWTAPVPVTFVAAATTDFGGNTSGNATIPVGTQVGDTVFIFVGSDAGTGLNLPAGWSTVVFDTANTVGIRVAYKQMLSSVDANVLVNGLSTASVAVTRTYRGSIDFENIQNSITTAATATTADAPLLNINTQQGVVVASAFIDDDNITSVVAPTGYSNLSWFSSTTAEFNVLTADKAYSTAVSEDPAAFTTTPTFTDSVTAITLSIPLRTGVASISSLGATGAIGTVTRIAYQLVGQTAETPAYTASTVGSATLPGASWSATVPTATVGNVIWYIYGQYNPNAFISQGIAANTTTWSAPIAASIFQDIRSDNWNGSNPPTETTSTWGTNGYYINRTNGIMVANSFYARGKMQVEGNNTDLLGTALKANSTGAADIGVYSYSGGGTAGRGVVGVGNTDSSVGVLGTASGATASSGVLALATSGATTALTIQGGTFKTDNSTLVTNLNADLLDGKHASALVQVASGTTNANYLYYLNNNTTPSNQTTRAAWIKISTNDGGVFWVEGYI